MASALFLLRLQTEESYLAKLFFEQDPRVFVLSACGLLARDFAQISDLSERKHILRAHACDRMLILIP